MPKDVSDIAALVELHRANERKEDERRQEAEKAAQKAEEDEKERDQGALTRSRTGQFLPGASGNPGAAGRAREGRAKSLARVLSEESNDGLEFIERMLKFARGQIDGLTPKEQYEVNRYLFERLAGKTPDTVLVADVSAHPALDALTVDELRRFAQGDDDDA